jgi:hypothetical protein
MEELALHVAKKYRPPESEECWSRDWINQHAIFTIENGKVRYKETTKCTFQENFGKYRRDIVKQFIDSVGLTNTFKMPFDMSLHDFVGEQMNTDEFPHSILGASLLENDRTNVMIPDFYAMKNYDGKLDDPDLMIHRHKVDRLLFIGSTTGNPDPYKNTRIQFCTWARNHTWVDAYISDVQQMQYSSVLDHLMHVPISPRFQKMYKHIANIDGNTAAWDRIPWVLRSNSTLWKYESPHQCWYYPLMKPWTHYVPFTLDTLEKTWSERDVRTIYKPSTEFLNFETQKEYCRLVFEHIKDLKEP